MAPGDKLQKPKDVRHFSQEEQFAILSKKVLAATIEYLPLQDPTEIFIKNFLNPQTDTLLGKRKGQILASNTNEDILKDQTRFVEAMDMVKEYRDIFFRTKERVEHDPVATEQEMKLRVLQEQLEHQVAGAVNVLTDKGYHTFESGFYEQKDRSQDIGFYDETVTVPQEIIKTFAEQGMKVSVEQDESAKRIGGIRIVLTPQGKDPVRSEQWKKYWDELASMMPTNNSNISAIAQERLKMKTTLAESQEKLKETGTKGVIRFSYWVTMVDGRVVSPDVDDELVKKDYGVS